ncbi:MAG: Ig-like domain-containing protein, partial [Acutalibacteraceae bacterium]|nr:Ig-like domain-containing protein [Acutalibacteraceae bacterium]
MKISKKVLATLLSSLIIATTITPITASAEEQQPMESSSENIILSDIETESSTANNVFTDESNKQDTSVTSQAVNDITESNKNLAGIITFEIPDNWRNNNRFYYAHIWNGLPEGEGLYEWQSSSELMTVNLDETKATYNIPQGDWNLIIISGDSGIQTFDTVFNQNCIGDTCYIDEEKFEDPAIYGKALTALLWKNNPDCGPHKMVTSLGKVVGFSYLPGETDQDLYNNFVNLYGDDSKQWESTVGVQAGITWEEAKIKVATELGLVNEVTSVQLNKTALTLGVGETTTLTATTIPSNSSSTYIWSSNNVNVATVNSNGKITAKSSGTATITVKTNNGKTATCKVTVKPAPTSVKVSATSKTLGVGETFIISESTNSGSYASTFTWSSSNNNVATVKKT